MRIKPKKWLILVLKISGLSPDLHTVEDINLIDRFTEPPSSGLMCDLLWADPMEDFSHNSDEGKRSTKSHLTFKSGNSTS